jgi:hypothetical protein
MRLKDSDIVWASELTSSVLANLWNTHQKTMPSSKNGDRHLVDNIIHSDACFSQLGNDRVPCLTERLNGDDIIALRLLISTVTHAFLCFL